MACLTPTGIDNLKKMLQTEGTHLSQLAKMDTVKRKAAIESYMGEGLVDYVNYQIERRIVAKTTQGLKNWVAKEVTNPREKSDILKRVAKLEADIKDENALKLLSEGKSREGLIEDLIAHKIGVGVTQKEAGTILELALDAREARNTLRAEVGAQTNYGKAYNDIKQGKPEQQALKDNNITKKEFDELTKKRVEEGIKLYKYQDYMDNVKTNAEKLKTSDFTDKWWVGSKKLGTEVFESIRALLASGELGFIFRQGLKSMYYDPKVWLQNSLEAVDNAKKGLKNEDFKVAIMVEVMTRPNYLTGHYAEAGLAINTVEDYFKNAWIERITQSDKPNIFQDLGQRYIKFSQDTYLAYLYKMRADLFDAHWQQLEQAGADYKSIGDFFNNLTGRGEGNIGGKRGQKGLGEYFMFAPKYVQSHLNTFTKMFTEQNPKLRYEYFKNFATVLGGTSLIIGLAAAMGAEVEEDPRSTKFGRITFSNGYIMDISGGLASYVVLMSRLLTGSKKTGKGKVRKLGDFGVENAQQLIANFAFSKGSPQVSLATALLNRELFGGEELTTTSLASSLMPIFGQEAYDKLTDDNIEALGKLLLTTSAFFGLSSYNPKDFDKKRSK